jgi:hypothetical protein
MSRYAYDHTAFIHDFDTTFARFPHGIPAEFRKFLIKIHALVLRMALVSITIVTGPSFIDETAMSPPKTPV